MRHVLLLLFSMSLCLSTTGQARVGRPINLVWDFDAVMPTGAVAFSFQVQGCPTAACAQPCTPVDVPGATLAASGVSWGSSVASGTWAADTTQKTATFAAVSAQYVRLVETSEINGNPWASAAEVTLYASGTQVAPSLMSILSTDSQEVTAENGQALRAVDNNTTTFWHTEWSLSSPAPPHDIVINLGGLFALTELRYLPRQDGNVNGTIGGYQISTRQNLHGFTVQDSAVVGGFYYRYQVVTVGQVNGVAARSDPSNQICAYIPALHRGRPDAFGFPR